MKSTVMKSDIRILQFLIFSLALIIMIFWVSSAQGSTTFEPIYQPSMDIFKVKSEIKIDGNLSMLEWNEASQTINFVENFPGDNTEPQVRTKAFITYDDDKLYIAFLCYDTPDAIRATMCQRDRFGSDDAVGLLIDTYGTASWAYQFFVNPYGIQKDLLWTKVGMPDIGFDLIWESAAQITDSGYQVEIAIPFSGMRFPSKDIQSWKVDFQRNRPRGSYYQYSWTAYDRNEQCFPCQWGTVEGIKDVRPGKGFEILPSFIANQSGELPRGDPQNQFDEGPIMGEPSLGAKYSLSSDVTFEATLNPDFSQIEADAAQIDVNSTMSLYYPERRPFFQEGSDIFLTLFNSFYTRTVNDPSFASKLTGRKEKLRFGFTSAIDENSPYTIPTDDEDIMFNGGKSYINAFRLSQSIGSSSQIGILLGDRRFDGSGSNTIAAFDGDIRLGQNYSIDGQYVLTHTSEQDNHSRTKIFGSDRSEEFVLDSTRVNGEMTSTFNDGKHTLKLDGESFSGLGLITRFHRRARHWNFTVDYNQVDKTYRTQLGYDPYNNYRNLDIRSFYVIYPKNSSFQRITPFFAMYNRWNFESEHKIRNIYGNIQAQLDLAQTNIQIGGSQSEKVYQGQMYEDLWNVNLNSNSRFSDKFAYGMNIRYGRDIGRGFGVRDNEFRFNMFVNIKPLDRLTIEPSFNYLKGTNDDRIDTYGIVNDELTLIHSLESGAEIFEQMIFRSRLQLQVNKQLSLRLVTQFNKFEYLADPASGTYLEFKRWEVDPLITYRLGSFSVFYIGSTSDVNYLSPEISNVNESIWKLNNQQFFMKLQYLFQM
ncbi:MAG: DUF5916 domain-containing protein [candidate division Zixibacteria bacterium]